MKLENLKDISLNMANMYDYNRLDKTHQKYEWKYK